MNRQDIEIIATKPLYQGFFSMTQYQFRFRKYDGSWSEVVERDIFERGDAVAVLLYDPQRKHVVLVEQVRLPALEDPHSPWLIELVAGILEQDEAPEQVAEREAKEEAKLVIKQLIPITTYWSSPGGSSERVSLYCGIVDASHTEEFGGLADEHEDIRILSIPAQQAFDFVRSGRINNAASIIALQWLELRSV